MMDIHPAAPVHLYGDAYDRGRAQAACAEDLIPAVQSALDTRLTAGATLLEQPKSRRYLDQQRELLKAVDPEGEAEIAGIADGFRRPFDSVLAYLHLGVLADFAVDGCSAWSWGTQGPIGPLVVKNRDYRGEHVRLQRVFLHHDPHRPGEAILCVGSLGSPGAFSSGMNTHGLALVDTQVSTRDHGPGLLRYFLMTRLLWQCRSVSEALQMISEVPHAGGGTLILGDATGACAAVELGHSAWSAESGGTYAMRTNHFLTPECAPFWIAPDEERAVASTKGRHARLQSWLAERSGSPTLDEAAEIMGSHRKDDQEALCRHGEDGDSLTISCAIFAPAKLRLYFSAGKPCAGKWSSFDCRP
jgi:predicted choloylglycine hydrolase